MKSKILIEEDSIDMKIAKDRLKDIEEGKCVVQTKKEFIEEMKKWIEINQ